MTRARRVGAVAVIGMFLASFLVVSGGILTKSDVGGDYWAHVAAIRAIAEGSEPEEVPLPHAPGQLHRLYDPFHVGWAIVMRQTGLSGTDVMALAGVVNVAAFLCGVAFLARCFARGPAMAGALLMTMLFMWGTGYGWSNEYYISALPRIGPWPSALAWGISFFAFGLIYVWSRRGGPARLAGAVVLGAAVAMIHPLTALMFTLTFPVLWVWLSRVPWRRRWLVLIYPCVALGLSLLWPHTSVVDQVPAVASQGMIHLGGQARGLFFLSPRRMLLALGPVPAGVLFLMWLPARWRLQLALAVVAYALCWVGASLLGVPLAHRLVFCLVFVLQLTAALSFGRGWRVWLRSPRLAMPAAVAAWAVLLIPWMPLHMLRLADVFRERIGIRTMTIRASDLEQFEESCARLRQELPPGAKILTDQSTSYEAAAFGLPVVRGGGLRQPGGRDTPDFVRLGKAPERLGPQFLAAVRRSASRFEATHLLLRQAEVTPAEKQALERLGPVRRMSPDIVLVKLSAQTP